MSFKFEDMEVTASCGLDDLFERNPGLTHPQRIRVASVADLEGFTRLSSEMLIHKSTQDLWALRKDANGFTIERLFNGEDPIKE